MFIPCLQRRLAEEFERCQNYLDVSSRKHLIHTVEQELLQKHMVAVLERGFDALMSEQR